MAHTTASLDNSVTPASETSSAVSVRNLRKKFRREDGSEVHAINNVNFDVAPGEFIVLLGPSGCGKTTLLRAIAGLETPDTGTIEIGGTTRFSSEAGIVTPPERRKTVLVLHAHPDGQRGPCEGVGRWFTVRHEHG